MNNWKNLFSCTPEKYYLITLILLCLIFLFAGIWSYPLLDVDETRYAVMSRDLINSGNWNLLFVNGVPFIEKPPLYFWLTAISIKLFDFNEFAVRLPVGLLAALTVVATYFTGRKIQNAKFGFYSAIILLCSAFFIMLAHVAILDMVFTAFCTLAIYCGIMTDYSEKKGIFWHLFYINAALAFLAKGLLGLIIPMCVVGIFKIIFKGFKMALKDCFNPKYFISGMLLFLLINFPWHYEMYKIYGKNFLYEYFIVHHFARFVNAEVLGKTRPLLYFIPVMIIGFLPWTPVLFLRLFKAVKENGFKDKWGWFFFLYFSFIFTLFSCASGKLPTYILPAFPACAFLCAQYLVELKQKYLNYGVAAMFVANLVCLLIVFPLIYKGGMNELVAYSKIAQNANSHLISFNMQLKPSLLLNYHVDKIDFIIENDVDKLKDILLHYPKSYVIVRNDKLKNSDYKTVIQKDFSLIRNDKKYSLYAKKES